MVGQLVIFLATFQPSAVALTEWISFLRISSCLQFLASLIRHEYGGVQLIELNVYIPKDQWVAQGSNPASAGFRLRCFAQHV